MVLSRTRVKIVLHDKHVRKKIFSQKLYNVSATDGTHEHFASTFVNVCSIHRLFFFERVLSRKLWTTLEHELSHACLPAAEIVTNKKMFATRKHFFMCLISR